ncbi:ATP-binding protein [Dechloromonas sp. ZY10]|uniref:sensor histidine kinase n=1 Tax=Dechloromonas aquae TaxID=2664436 RepID=UPI0035293583
MTEQSPIVVARCNELIYRNQWLGQIVSIVNALLLSVIAWLVAPAGLAPVHLLGWLLLAIATAGLRLGMARRFQQLGSEVRQADATGWRRRALLGALASGCVWAAGGLQMMLAGDTVLQIFVAFVLAGMVAGAVPVLAADRIVFRCYAWPVVGAAIIGGIGGEPLQIAYTAMAAVFLLTATRSADNFHAVLHDSIRLEQEKAALVDGLEAARIEAESSNRTKTEFLANISHELRTPMNGILGMTELLALEELPPEQHEMLEHLHEAARLMNRHVDALILLSNLEAGQIQPRSAPFALAELAEAILAGRRLQATVRQLRLIEEIDPALPEFLECDAEQLRSALQHLLDNAIKFTDHGEIRVAIRLLSRSTEQAVVEFSVADNGPGIAAPILQALRKGLMLQADGSSIRRHGGIGLGLPLARKLIRLLGGELQIDSEPGVGSRFHFSLALPLGQAPEQA